MNDFYPMTTAELMDRSIDVYKKSFGRQMAYAAICTIASYILFFVASFAIIMVVAISVPDMFGPSVGNSASSVAGVILLVIAIIVPIFLLWMAAINAGPILLSWQAFHGRKLPFPYKQIPRAIGRIFSALLAQVIAILPFAGLMFLGVRSGFAVFLIERTPWLFVVLCLMFFVAFLLYINIFSLAIAVAAFERVIFFKALTRSWELIKGEFWKIAGMRLLWYTAIMVIAMSFSGVTQALYLLVIFLSETFDMGVAGFILIGISLIISMVVSFGVIIATMPLDGIFVAVLYFNQRIKREGLDIEVKLARL